MHVRGDRGQDHTYIWLPDMVMPRYVHLSIVVYLHKAEANAGDSYKVFIFLLIHRIHGEQSLDEDIYSVGNSATNQNFNVYN